MLRTEATYVHNTQGLKEFTTDKLKSLILSFSHFYLRFLHHYSSTKYSMQ
jgi:hypothetical protein